MPKNVGREGRSARWWRVAAFSLLMGCGGHGAEQKTQSSGSAVLAERAKVLDEPSMRALSSATLQANKTVLEFSSRTSLLKGLQAGDVLILGATKLTPKGALVAVDGVESKGAGVLLTGHPAALGEAFERLQIDLQTALAHPTKTSTSVPKSRSDGVAHVEEGLGVSFAIDLGVGSDKNRIDFKGSLALDSDLDLTLDFDFAKFALKDLSMSFGGHETFLAEIIGQGQESIEKTALLGSIAFAPITVVVPIPVPPGSVPVVLTPRVDLKAGVKGSVDGETASSVTQKASFSVGLGYHDGAFKPFSKADSKFDREEPTYQAGVNLKAWAGPSLEVAIYGAVGPFAEVEAFVELAAEAKGPPPCAMGVLDAGLTGKTGVDFLANYSTTLFDEFFPLAQYDSCSNDPKAPRPAVTWARSYGRAGSSGETARAVVQALDGSYLVVGDSSLFDGVSAFAAAGWALRLDPLGNVVWQRAFQRLPAFGMTRAAAALPDGFLVAGTGGLMKLDSGGNLVWARTYDAEGLQIASLAALEDGSALVVGSIGSTGKAWAMKLSAEGQIAWSRRYAGSEFTRVRTTRDGGYIAVGNTDSNNDDIALAKLGTDGQVSWARALDDRYDASPGMSDPSASASMPAFSSASDSGYDVVEKPGGGYVIVGQSYGNFPVPEPTSLGYYASFVAEVDAQGGLQGSTLYRAPSDAMYGAAYAVGVRPNGSTVILGRRADQASDLLSNEDVLVIQDGAFDALGGSGNDGVDTGTLSGDARGMPFQMTADGGSIVAVTSNSFGGRDQFWLVKLNRTAGINFSERQGLSGSSYENEHAISADASSASAKANVTAATVTADFTWESTPLVSAQQAP